jgi:hypothetical protein
MRIPAALLALCLPATLSGQARYTATFGLTAGTRLVSDQIFQTVEVAQQPAPTVTLGVSFPVSAKERAGLEVALGFGGTRIQETGLPEADGPSYRALSITAGVEGPVIDRLSLRGAAGVLKYLPDDAGIFRGGGPLLFLLSGGLDYRLPVQRGLGFLIRLRYDYQRFSTNALERAGFARTQDVHRLGLGLGVEYSPP